jgi:hypothetical protein
MSDIKGLGPALPVAENQREEFNYRIHLGTTLRDWFAGQALMGLLADSNNCSPYKENAVFAYVMADEMLKAREAQK